MNWLKRIFQTARSFVRNRYEAAVTWWGSRSYIPAGVQDARFDADASTRLELVRKHRYWVRNSELVQRIRNLFVQFSVGPSGLIVVPNSVDEEWNDARHRLFDLWWENPEISSRMTGSQLLIQWAGQLFDDGETFIIKRQVKGECRLQTIESHRCKSPKNADANKIIDGIEVDSNGTPVAYYFTKNAVGWLPSDRESVIQDEFERIPAEFVIHLFKARRPGMLRGIPEGFSCMNTLHDYEDLHMLEMKACRKLANIAAVVTNSTGEADVAAMRRQRSTINSQDAAGNPVTKDRALYYDVKLGGETIYAKSGETVQQFNVDRPSIVTQQYWDLLLSQICCGYNVPKLLVVPYSLQGTVTRADLDICTNAFRFNFEIIANGLRDIYRWQTEWAVKFDKALDGEVPRNYRDVEIRPPRSPNVDIGRNAQALAIELELGVTTYQNVFAERQQDWRTEFHQAAECAAYLKKLAAEFSTDGVTISEDDIAKKLKNSVSPTKDTLDTYGVAVRAGVITPNIDDEKAVRAKLKLPAVNKDVERVWQEDGGARRPITLSTPDQIEEETTADTADTATTTETEGAAKE